MYLGGKYKVSWSNDDLERFLMFLKVRALGTAQPQLVLGIVDGGVEVVVVDGAGFVAA